MKTKILLTMIAVVIISVSGYNIYQSQKFMSLPDLTLANVEALADYEQNDVDCVSEPRASCSRVIATPNGNYVETYYDQTNKI